MHMLNEIPLLLTNRDEPAMSLNGDQIGKIAHLARLELHADEIQHHADQLSRVIDLVGQLAQADTEGVAPMAHPLAMVQRLRADRVTEPDLRERYQAQAPAVQDGLYLVPKVIE